MPQYNFVNYHHAVNAALDEIGDQTSIDTFRKKAIELWNMFNVHIYDGKRHQCSDDLYSNSYLYTLRSQWRQNKKRANHDCRTYEGQPRRDMLRDDQLNRKTLDSLAELVSESVDNWLEILDGFHSIDQLRNAVRTCKDWSNTVDLQTA